MDKFNYDCMLTAFNSVLDRLPADIDDETMSDVITLKSLFIDLYGDSDE